MEMSQRASRDPFVKSAIAYSFGSTQLWRTRSGSASTAPARRFTRRNGSLKRAAYGAASSMGGIVAIVQDTAADQYPAPRLAWRLDLDTRRIRSLSP